LTWTERVSVIVPTYNRAGLVRASVESALAQTYLNIEVIVVDDGSTDSTLEVLGAISDRRLQVIPLASRRGGAYARNRGISHASGRFVGFLDSDDIWAPEKIERQMLALAACDRPDRVVCYTQVNIAGGLFPIISPSRALGAQEHISDYLWRHGGFMQTSSLLISRALLQEVAFDPMQKRHHDWDLLFRLFQRDVAFCFVEEPLVSYNADAGVARISRDEDPEASLAWLEDRRALVTPAAYSVFRARRAPALARRFPALAFGAILQSRNDGFINSIQTLRYLALGLLGLLAPGAYKQLPDIRIRGAKLNPLKSTPRRSGLPVQRHN